MNEYSSPSGQPCSLDGCHSEHSLLYRAVICSFLDSFLPLFLLPLFFLISMLFSFLSSPHLSSPIFFLSFFPKIITKHPPRAKYVLKSETTELGLGLCLGFLLSTISLCGDNRKYNTGNCVCWRGDETRCYGNMKTGHLDTKVQRS